MHFNQCFSLVPCPLKGFLQGQEFKNWTNKHKGNKHRKQTDRQVEKSCATLRPGAAKGLLHTPSLTPWGRHSLAHLLPTLAMHDLGQCLPSLVCFPYCVVMGWMPGSPREPTAATGLSTAGKSTPSGLVRG